MSTTASGDDDLFVIAIDGPAGAGKSTVARALADRLDLEYLDTGAMYRAITFATLAKGVSVHDVDAVGALVPLVEMTVAPEAVTVDGVDVTAAIRSRDVTEHVSAIAANSAVRADLVARQRQWGIARGGGVIEGRDIGSVVFPDARLKIYVTATPRVRAERRVGEIGGDVDEVEAAIGERDRRDSSRTDSPLREADGSHMIDTSGRAVADIVDEIVELLR
ncbi:MAG: (d)CMP kinase [Actinomycetota bacterium]|nr:(d)CMP kinase [Actinomycetota bacterium]